MKVKKNHYVPVLKWRQAEYQSLTRLTLKQKNEVIPLVVIPPLEYDFETKQPTKTIQEHVDKFISRYVAKWGSRRAFIDLYPDLHNGTVDSGVGVFDYVFSRICEKNCDAVPVLSSIPDTIETCCIIAIKAQNGIALRVHPDNILDGSLLTCMDYIVNVANIPRDDIDIILDIEKPDDFEPIEEFASALSGLINSIDYINDFRSLILLGTSIRLSEVVKPGGVLFRYEWALYKEIIKTQYNLSRIPAFGDYTIETPAFAANLDFTKISPSAKIVYTTDEDWYVVKGSAYRKDTTQMVALSTEIMKSKHYKGPDFSFGDQRIKEIVDSEAKPGNLTTMKHVGISHHLAFILNELATIHEI